MFISKDKVIRAAIRIPDIAPRPRHALMLMIDHANIDGHCHIEPKTLAADVGIRRVGLCQLLRPLRDAGWVTLTGDRNRYQLNIEGILHNRANAERQDYVLVD